MKGTNIKGTVHEGEFDGMFDFKTFVRGINPPPPPQKAIFLSAKRYCLKIGWFFCGGGSGFREQRPGPARPGSISYISMSARVAFP